MTNEEKLTNFIKNQKEIVEKLTEESNELIKILITEFQRQTKVDISTNELNKLLNNKKKDVYFEGNFK